MEKCRKSTINDVINPLALWGNALLGTNKWLIREFPEDLSMKEAISASQGSSLFDYELRTPSLDYAAFE